MENDVKNEETKEDNSKQIKQSEGEKNEENKVIKIIINYKINPIITFKF